MTETQLHGIDLNMASQRDLGIHSAVTHDGASRPVKCRVHWTEGQVIIRRFLKGDLQAKLFALPAAVMLAPSLLISDPTHRGCPARVRLSSDEAASQEAYRRFSGR